MRILVISPLFPPHNIPGSLRAYYLVKRLQANQHDVTVLTTQKRPDQIGLSHSLEGIHVVSIPFRVPSFLERLRSKDIERYHKVVDREAKNRFSYNLWKCARQIQSFTGVFLGVRMPDFTDFWVKPAIEWTKGEKPWDIVVSFFAPYSSMLIARHLKKMNKTKYWFADYRDPWTFHHLFHGIFPFFWVEKVQEKNCFKYIDRITTVSQPIAKELERRSKKPTDVIYNGFENNSQGSQTGFSFPNDGKIRIVHTGTLYPKKQDPSIWFKTLSLLKDRNKDLPKLFSFVVAGSRGTEWLELSKKYGVLDLLDYRGVVPRDEALQMQKEAHALLFLDWNEKNRGVITSKLFDYISTNTPIISMGPQSESEANQIIVQTKRGNHFYQEEMLLNFLSEMIQNKDRTPMIGLRDKIDNYSRENQSKKWANLIQNNSI